MRFIDKKLLLFDLDGTLIDSVPDLALSINYTLKELQREPFEESTIRSWVGNGAQILVRRALSGDVEIEEGLDEKYFQKALKIFLEHYSKHLCVETKLYANVEKRLRELDSEGYILAIVTNKPSVFVAPILEEFKIASLFTFIVGGDSLAEKKPSPEPLLHICKEADIAVEMALMIGDSKNDILAAKAAGIESIAVSYGYNYAEDISSYNPDATVDDFALILKEVV